METKSALGEARRRRSRPGTIRSSAFVPLWGTHDTQPGWRAAVEPKWFSMSGSLPIET